MTTYDDNKWRRKLGQREIILYNSLTIMKHKCH